MKGTNFQQLQKLIAGYNTAILYHPLLDELDFHDCPIVLPAERFIISSNKNSEPFKLASECTARFHKEKVFVLIPGTKFDIYGTRYGRGGGWYDRFLSKIPPDWLRVGIIDQSNFSKTKLLRQPWDEPVDWVIVKNIDSWEAHRANKRKK